MDAGRFRKGKGCRFQHRKHQRVPVFSATVKDQGISLLVYSTQKVVECCTNVPFFGGKNLQKKRPHHIPPAPSPTKAYLHTYQWALVLLARECEK
jgi:hypothetical protein